MPDKETLERVREDAREGKSPSTQAGEFVREEMHHIRRRKTRSRVRQTGYRDWLVKGATVGREAGAAKGLSFHQHQEAGGSRLA